MALCSKLAELTVPTALYIYQKYVTVEKNGSKFLCVWLAKTLYHLMQSTLLFYHILWGELYLKGFVIIPYNPFMTNGITNSYQLIVVGHVDDFKISHHLANEVTHMLNWLMKSYKFQVVRNINILECTWTIPRKVK